jgi:purine-binding chemotaxis protein CheW
MNCCRIDDVGVESDVRRYLTFHLANETYCISLHQVREIRVYTHITSLPNHRDHDLGAMYLHGSFVAIVDLRIRLGMAQLGIDEPSIVVIVNTRGCTYGLRADAVSEIIAVSSDDIRPVPSAGACDRQRFSSGLARVQDKIIILLDLDRIVDIGTTTAEAA